MFILKHDGTVRNLTSADSVRVTNAHGFGNEKGRNPDNVGPVKAGTYRPWNRPYGR